MTYLESINLVVRLELITLFSLSALLTCLLMYAEGIKVFIQEDLGILIIYVVIMAMTIAIMHHGALMSIP